MTIITDFLGHTYEIPAHFCQPVFEMIFARHFKPLEEFRRVEVQILPDIDIDVGEVEANDPEIGAQQRNAVRSSQLPDTMQFASQPGLRPLRIEGAP